MLLITSSPFQDCDFTTNAPAGQIWSFDGSTLKIGNKCLDVTDGVNQNGVKLQVWTCASGNPNQQFGHSGGNVLNQPNDIITWLAHPSKCMDLTNGDITNGNQVWAVYYEWQTLNVQQIQLWTCAAGNTNQVS
jgi:hypothetical protein